MTVSARLSELERAMLEALCFGRSQTDVIREGLRMVWAKHNQRAMRAMDVINPEKADRLRTLLADSTEDKERDMQ